MKTLKIPEATIIRLSVYSRYLTQLDKNGITTISSGEIADGVGGTPAQVRKDLAYFGEFGTRGVGYNVRDLNEQIIKILGLSNKWNVVIVGAGNLGSALTQYKGFLERGFNVVAVFDNDINKVGLRLSGIPIYPIARAEEIVKQERVQIGIIAVPAPYAQEVADTLVQAGVKAILNFAPRVISVPDDIELRNVDLAVNLEILTFNLGMNKK
ncbi:redox-sensing transcriptional repressor Rex [Thermanaerosceptrum fracticalcis]|uniref:Redox-sensing transcriptional repressor Rex n=1 Tax=Thermanaerosceptrum fracticalcis TaxID=1712410 RepID=A0A7G6E666_THEFR|nr:redox-sensing transcriptional repressor Rex [Thermanaerosceptrum fracticalcis]QNB47570.1 redox-sensing transcriptional repressor Rex [Thermanaerosceptrum fracticalcis]